MLPSCSSDWGRRVFYSNSDQTSAAVALMAHSSWFFDRCLLLHWRFFVALLTGSSAGDTSYTSSPPDAVDRADDVPDLWQVVLEYPSGSPPNSRLASPPAFALVAQSLSLCDRWLLTHWRFFSVLSAGGVFGSLSTGSVFSAPCRPVVWSERLPQADSSPL